MKKNQIEKHLKSAIRDMTPDIFNQISSLEVPEEKESIIMNTKTSRLTKYIASFAACAAAIAIFAGVTVYASNYKVSSLISIDVNPSIEISTNKKDKVIKVVPLNEDGKIILDGMDLKNIDLNVVVNSIMGSMVKNGFIDDTKNSVLISVKNSDKEKSDELELTLIDDIRATLKENNVDANIYNQNLGDINRETEKMAKEYGISYGKMIFIKNIIDKDSSLSIEQLSKLTLEEISDLVKERKIDISNIVNYDSDDSISENIEESNDILDDKDNDNNKYGDKDNDNNKYGDKDNDNNKYGDKDNDNNKYGEKDNDNNKYGDKDKDNNKDGDEDKDNNKDGDEDKDNNKDGDEDKDNNKDGDEDKDNNKDGDKDKDNNKDGDKDNDNNKDGNKVKAEHGNRDKDGSAEED